MIRISAATHARTVATAADHLGVPLPAEYLGQVAEVDKFTVAVAATATTTSQLHDAVLDAIADGRDHTTDKQVMRLLLNRELTATNIHAGPGRQRADDMRAAALAHWADDILADWAEALEPHAAALAAAADAKLGLTDTAGVIARGGDNMHKLHAAQAAAKAWEAAGRGFTALAAVSGVRPSGDVAVAIRTPARLADLEPAFTLARKEKTDPDAWVLARCGIPLELATIGDFMARAATFNADHQAAQRAEAESRQQRRFENSR